jgi:hypothetical protein
MPIPATTAFASRAARSFQVRDALRTGADLCERDHRPGARRGVAAGAGRREHLLAARRSGRIDRERIGRRAFRRHILDEPAHLAEELGVVLGRRAEQAERGVDHHRIRVVAVAGEVHAHALIGAVLAEVPQRGHVGGAETVVHRPADHEVLGQVHRVVAAAAPGREVLTVQPGELLFALEQAFARDRDDHETIEQAVDEGQLGDQLDLGHQVVGVEAWVLGAVDQEAEEGPQVERVVGPGRHEYRRRIGLRAIARGVAGRTVVGHARKAHHLLREADRKLLAFFPHHAERGVAARAPAASRETSAAARRRSSRGCRHRARRRSNRT